MGPVDDVKQQVRVTDLLKSRTKRLDELCRQRADEANGVRKGEKSSIRGLCSADSRVEGGKQLVVNKDPGTGEPVQQGRLAGVGIARNGDAGDASCLATVTLGVPRRLHGLDLALELGDPAVDPTPVELDLGLTRAT